MLLIKIYTEISTKVTVEYLTAQVGPLQSAGQLASVTVKTDRERPSARKNSSGCHSLANFDRKRKNSQSSISFRRMPSSRAICVKWHDVELSVTA